VAQPDTVASAIRIGNPASWNSAVAARDESGGTIDLVSDDEILTAYRLLASREGVFCEPASAASVAGLTKLATQGRLPGDKRVVCVITGTGLKDPDLARRSAEVKLTEVKGHIEEVEEAVTASTWWKGGA